jgi:hypothetical protein
LVIDTGIFIAERGHHQEGCMKLRIQEKIALVVEWGVSLGITGYLALGVVNTFIVVFEH